MCKNCDKAIKARDKVEKKYQDGEVGWLARERAWNKCTDILNNCKETGL